MWIPLPPQSDDLVAETSRLDTAPTSRHFTVWDSSSGDVAFRARAKPQKFLSSNPGAVTAALLPTQLFTGLGSGDFPVQISGHRGGTAMITPVEASGKPLFNLTLEVDVLGRQEYRVNFHFVTDWLGGSTTRTEASV